MLTAALFGLLTLWFFTAGAFVTARWCWRRLAAWLSVERLTGKGSGRRVRGHA